MKFVFLLYGDEAAGQTPSQMPEDHAIAWQEFHETVERDGKLVSWQALHPSDTAQTLRNLDGDPIATDGPYAESKEQLGGFYMLECADMDEALSYASRMPCSDLGSIEVRPIVEYPA